jgi:SP family arabinose:H+ symporter-like MFS transporter
MAVCLTLIGAAFYFDLAKGFLVLIAILAYIAFFAISLGPLSFVVISEIFSNRNRGKAMAVAIFFLWASDFLVTQSVPVLFSSIGTAFTFWIFMLMAVLAFIFVYKVVPETKGKTLEEIEKYFMHAEDKMPSLDLSKTKSTL